MRIESNHLQNKKIHLIQSLNSKERNTRAFTTKHIYFKKIFPFVVTKLSPCPWAQGSLILLPDLKNYKTVSQTVSFL